MLRTKNVFFTAIVLLTVAVAPLAASEDEGRALPKIYLTTHFEPGVNFTEGGIRPSFILKYYFGYDKEYLDEVSYFGANLAQAVKPVPDAYSLMKTYLWSRIGSLACIVGGFGFFVCNFIYQYDKGMKEQRATGRPGSLNATPLVIGLGFVGAGVVLHFSRHIWIHAAVNTYNRQINGVLNYN
jgi:hypothetical protein